MCELRGDCRCVETFGSSRRRVAGYPQQAALLLDHRHNSVSLLCCKVAAVDVLLGGVLHRFQGQPAAVEVEQRTLRIHFTAEERVFLPFQCIVVPAFEWVAATVPADCVKTAGTQTADLPHAAGTNAVLRTQSPRPTEGCDCFWLLPRHVTRRHENSGCRSLLKPRPFSVPTSSSGEQNFLSSAQHVSSNDTARPAPRTSVSLSIFAPSTSSGDGGSHTKVHCVVVAPWASSVTSGPSAQYQLKPSTRRH